MAGLVALMVHEGISWRRGMPNVWNSNIRYMNRLCKWLGGKNSTEDSPDGNTKDNEANRMELKNQTIGLSSEVKLCVEWADILNTWKAVQEYRWMDKWGADVIMGHPQPSMADKMLDRSPAPVAIRERIDKGILRKMKEITTEYGGGIWKQMLELQGYPYKQRYARQYEKYDAFVNKINKKDQVTLESIRIMHDEIRKNALKVQRYEREEMGADAVQRLIEEERREKEVNRLTTKQRFEEKREAKRLAADERFQEQQNFHMNHGSGTQKEDRRPVMGDFEAFGKAP